MIFEFILTIIIVIAVASLFGSLIAALFLQGAVRWYARDAEYRSDDSLPRFDSYEWRSRDTDFPDPVSYGRAYLACFFAGIVAHLSGVIVSILWENYANRNVNYNELLPQFFGFLVAVLLIALLPTAGVFMKMLGIPDLPTSLSVTLRYYAIGLFVLFAPLAVLIVIGSISGL